MSCAWDPSEIDPQMRYIESLCIYEPDIGCHASWVTFLKCRCKQIHIVGRLTNYSPLIILKTCTFWDIMACSQDQHISWLSTDYTALYPIRQNSSYSRHCFGDEIIHILTISMNRRRISEQPITVATRSEAWTVFARSNTGIVDLNPTRDMDVCVRLFCVCLVLCVGSDLSTGWSPFQGVLTTVSRIKKLNAPKHLNQYGPKTSPQCCSLCRSN
jgi:hypothetical protein